MPDSNGNTALIDIGIDGLFHSLEVAAGRLEAT